MKKHFILFVLVCSLVLVGCPRPIHETTKHYEYQEGQNGSTVAPPAPLAPSPTEPGWVNEKIQVTGQGAVNPKFAHNPPQQKLMAKRAAIMDARRNLLERVLGLRLDSQTTVKDMVAESDLINAETSGFLKESYEIGEHFDGGIYTVNMELKLYSVYMTMKTQKIYYK
ncbi:MAG: hypothetical protein HUU50_15855 [Candidatus Brocadiae bacterium]|nr:hypothetical protein [Candidatus Brocadiia bacterium]